MNFNRFLILVLSFCLGFNLTYAQATYRLAPNGNSSGNPALRVVPCNGDVLFEEHFDAGIPSTWTILDIDNLTPEPALGLSKGWQARQDYKDTTNNLVVSPSWYSPVGKSDDWLITPMITLGSNPCLSWVSYSQDRFFPEAFEIRISTTTPDTAGFFAHPAVDSITAEDGDFEYRAASLSAWAGQSVYIAFRQTSDDKFVLALDDVSVVNVNSLDAGISAFANTGGSNPGDSIIISGEIANYGTDTLRSVTVNYSVDGGPVFSMLLDSIKVFPFQTLNFAHDSIYFSDTLDHFYDICVWTSSPNAGQDGRISNDTLCAKVEIGNPIAVDAPIESVRFQVMPNPSNGFIRVRLNKTIEGEGGSLQVVDLTGKTLAMQWISAGESEISWDLSGLPRGLYVLAIETADGNRGFRKIIIE